MMHLEEIIAVLCDTNKKPLRELDSQRVDQHSRKAKVYLPFGSEYQFLVKNQSDRRIIIRAEIDGTNVTGNGLILDAHSSDYIERFVDAAKKFLFVKATDERVGDPTNRENGVIKIRIRKEKKPVVVKEEHHHHHHHNDYWFGPYRSNPQWPGYPSPSWYSSETVYKGTDGIGSVNASNASYGAVVNDSAPTAANHTKSLKGGNFNPGVLRSANMVSSQPQMMSFMAESNNLASDVGATVEGGMSNQFFGKTTWNGDEDIETSFTFHMIGVDAVADVEKAKKMDQFLKLKEELGIK